MYLLLETLELETGSCDSLQLDLEEAQIGILICSLLKVLLGIGVGFVDQWGWGTSWHLQQWGRPTLVLKPLRIIY
jgi:hypothetical protein